MPGYCTQRKALWKLVAVLCCVLIACAAGVQAAHFHPGSADSSLCALCHVAHVAVCLMFLVILASAIVIATGFVSSTTPARPPLFFAFSLFTRPPPVDAAFA